MVISTTEFKANLDEYLSLSATEDIFITHNGKIISLLTSPFANREKNAKLQPKMIALDSMTKEEFDSMMEESYKQAINGEGVDLNTAFDILQREVHSAK